MRRFLVFLSFVFVVAGLRADMSTWGQLGKSIMIHPGLTTGAWDEGGRSDATNSGLADPMTPVGDGTYQYKAWLTPGVTYNFIFFAWTSSSPPTGLSANTTYYDIIPNSGSGKGMVTSTSSSTISGTNTSWFVNISGDARRAVWIPASLGSNATYWVFSNFGSSPTLTQVNAVPGNQSVSLSWTPYGEWGTGDETMKAADVIAGGMYHIYRSSNQPSGSWNFELILSTSGEHMSYTDTNVTNGTTYYYVVISSDAYDGTGLISNLYSPQTASSTTYQASAQPRQPIPVYFKVEKLDWDYVEKHGFIVYLTPKGFDARTYPNKIPARITRVYLPRG